MANSDVGFMYDKIGKDFSRTRRSNWPEVKKYLSLVTPGMSVLDLGCGNGRLNFDLPSEIDYTGVDASEVLINEAKQLFPKRKFILGDALVYESDKKYDAVFCVAVVHHMKRSEVERVMRVIRESMGDKGFAIITCWNLWQKRYWKNHLMSWKSKFADWRNVTVPYQGVPRHCVAWTKSDLTRMVADVGFTSENVSTGRNYVIYLRK